MVPAYDSGPRYDPAPAVTVYAAPPAPLVEYRSLPPAQGYLWLDGYWNWGGAHYAWVPGRWVNPPPGQVWAPRVWQRDGERWHSHGGHWEEHREDRRRPSQFFVSPRDEFQPQPVQRSPERWPRPEWRPEPQPEPHRHPSRDGAPAPAFSRPSMLQPPVQGAGQPMPEPRPRKAEGPQHRVPSEDQRMAPAVAPRSEPPPRSAEAAPQRRAPDEGGRRMDRRRPDDGEPRDRH